MHYSVEVIYCTVCYVRNDNPSIRLFDYLLHFHIFIHEISVNWFLQVVYKNTDLDCLCPLLYLSLSTVFLAGLKVFHWEHNLMGFI